MTSKQDALRRAAVASHLARVASQEKKKALAELEELMGPGESAKALFEGEEIGTVSVTRGSPRYQVVDEDALVTWLEWNKPDAVKKTAAPWFVAAANLDAFVKQTGEIPDGVEVVTPDPRISARVSSKQADTLRELIATGNISLLEGVGDE